jgi:hypothetical protein
MPAERFVTEESGPSRSRVYLLWVLPVVFLVGVWLWLVLSDGGYPARNWAFPALAVGVAGIAGASLLGYPRRPRQLSIVVLALFTAYSVWVFASNLWAGDTSRSWPASGRTFLYLLVLALALAYFTTTHGRTAFKYLLMAAPFVLLVVVIWRLWSARVLAGLFIGNRLGFPVGRPDETAALFLVSFWPLMWLAAGPREPAPIRGAALGLATGMVGLAILTQSRGAAWSLGISVVLMFALSPGRLRLLFYLVVPSLLMVYAFPHLNRYWTQDPAIASGGLAARTLTIAVLAGGFIGMIVALLEDWVKVSRRMKFIFGCILLLACAAALVYGSLTFAKDAGGPVTWFGDAWQRLASEPAAENAASDTTTGPLATRGDVWKASWQEFEHRLVIGSGEDARAAEVSLPAGPQAGSLALRILSDTGVVGAFFVFAAILLSVVGILWPRTAVALRRTGRGGGDVLEYGWQMALLGALAYWFAQTNLNQLWQIPAVTVPAVLMLAAAMASSGAPAGVLWPRLGGSVRPEGPLSQTFRIGLLVVSAALVILTVSAYFLDRV